MTPTTTIDRIGIDLKGRVNRLATRRNSTGPKSYDDTFEPIILIDDELLDLKVMGVFEG